MSSNQLFQFNQHFVGVVEDRNDPEQLGRLKVRIYSSHKRQVCNTNRRLTLGNGIESNYIYIT